MYNFPLISNTEDSFVKRVDYEMQPKAGFLSLADELRFYILSFLSYQDILRCTSVSHNHIDMSLLS
ncbi:uncharacterized protein BJ212DRAFT_1393791 [Suillus subaureus]|uniref:F-box domain-containing protein n=1 Tax=Suillus subaureus TaxID=48587 RepID=A0A9P7DVM1_9AGAM|nr:uncharacterized protein BJ212DRAFT_1393791 [Suillus subaureus]KAG1804393.1 hypothetical protein BJ212DRAFT_1393791 [Suillus subaureus]